MSQNANQPTRTATTVSIALFLSLFAAQAGLIATAPTLAQVAADLDVSTAAAGQLRTIAGIAAALTAITAGRRLRGRLGLGRQLLAASLLLAIGSAASALAPSFELLAASQVPVGIGVAGLTTAGTLAAAEWVPAERRARALSWALVGQPAAWIVGMPLVGVVGQASWRYGWLVLPLAAALAAAAAVASRVGEPAVPMSPARAGTVLGDTRLRRWLASELCANAAWVGTLVYAGALLVEAHGASVELAGILLALVAAAFAAGNLAGRRLGAREPRQTLVLLGLVLALTNGLFWTIRPDVSTSVALLAAAAVAAGARTLVSSTLALADPPELRSTAMGLRVATTQVGYFVGSVASGLALTAGGYDLLGVVIAALFLAGAALLAPVRALRPDRGATPDPGGRQPTAGPASGGVRTSSAPLPAIYPARG